jgi:class 3 adenylate cyclase
MPTIPETRFVRAGDVDIAYQTFGSGDPPLVWVPGWISHVEAMWDLPEFARFLEGLGHFSRVAVFDKRGTGMSDRMGDVATLEDRMDDIRAVMDAAEFDRAVLFGWADAGTMLALFAATHPDRVEGLVVGEPTVKLSPDGSEPWGYRPEILATSSDATGPQMWGRGGMLAFVDPSAPDDERIAAWWRRYERVSSTPSAAATMLQVIEHADVRTFLVSVQAPTLVLHRQDSQLLMPGAARYFADQIAGARYRELPGESVAPYLGDQDSVLAEVQEFVTGTRAPTRTDRFLATVVFTDIVGSTVLAEELGDATWRDTLATHHALLEQVAARQSGRIVNTSGDGALALFDGPTRAVNYASAVVEAVHELGHQIRAGVHTGEVERRGANDVAGLAVHVGARVGAHAVADEVLVTSTVRDLTAGSGLQFADRGEHDLKGVANPWRLYALVG